MRRNKEQKEKNKKLLLELFEHNKISNNEAIVCETDLRKEYVGSLPYPTPTTYGNVWIKQLPKIRGDKWNTYSIFILGKSGEQN